ncbi:hypothetical protein [Dehalobacter sp. TBBPA1]|uniref:hypothetical protein n=1 Tax=Dehalobacter sp. TBBPA1 TaxID=3235037 RepID=UPI0034A12764
MSSDGNHINSETENVRFLAFFDILGFRNLVNNHNLSDITSLMNDVFRSVLRFSNSVYDEDGVALSEQMVSFLQFSDSIVFYTTGTKKEEFSRLVHVCKVFVYSCFVAGIPIRGSISKGEFYVDNDLFFGKALIEAYENGERQQWVGAFINNSCVKYIQEYYSDALDFLQKKGYLVRGDIPIKVGVIQDQYIINWANEDFLDVLKTPARIRVFFMSMDVYKWMDKTGPLDPATIVDLSQFPVDESVERKISNTIAFWEEARNLNSEKILKFKTKAD